MNRLTRRGLLVGGMGALAAGLGSAWLLQRPRSDGLTWIQRRSLEVNSELSTRLLGARGVDQPQEAAREPGARGVVGLEEALDPLQWVLSLSGPGGDQRLDLGQLHRFPLRSLTTELRCVEGWTRVTQWGGVGLAELLQQFPVAGEAAYAWAATPDRGYYVGLDRLSALHPQTLLAYQVNGRTLTVEEGGPVRLVIPVKYGFKWLKRLGSVTFSSLRPPDYWAQYGYDWHAGL